MSEPSFEYRTKEDGDIDVYVDDAYFCLICIHHGHSLFYVVDGYEHRAMLSSLEEAKRDVLRWHKYKQALNKFNEEYVYE